MSITTLDFEGLAAGTIIDDEFLALGVEVSVIPNVDRGGRNDVAMVFDTNAPTGGDTDLSFDDQGGVLIISEDGDSTDPDDDRGGGVFTFDFAEPVDLESIVLLDIEEAGEIRAFDENGVLIGVQTIAAGVDNGREQVALSFDGVSRMEVHINGSGALDDLVFSSPDEPPQVVNPDVGGETADGTDVTFEIEAPAEVTSETSTLSAALTLGAGGAQNNVAFVIDVSGSTSFGFQGSPVGDLNGDGLSNTILDAEIASFQNLSNAIAALNLPPQDVDIGLITFDTNAQFVGVFEPGAPDLNSTLADLEFLDLTNFEAALQQVLNFFQSQTAAGDTNIVYFLSDGFPNTGGSFADEVDALEASFGAQIIGVGVGTGSSLFDLDDLDNTGGAQQVTSTDELDAALLSSAIDVDVTDFVVEVNGIEQPDIDETDLIETLFGFELPETEIGNLDPTLGANNDVTATITLSDGTEFELTAMLTGAGFEIDNMVA